MKNSNIKKILDAHSTPNFEKEGRIYADSMLSGSDLFEKRRFDLLEHGKDPKMAWILGRICALFTVEKIAKMIYNFR